MKPGVVANTVRIEKNGDEIRAYADGTFLMEATSNTLGGSKGLGIRLTGSASPGLDIRFDNYKVEAFGCGLSSSTAVGPESSPSLDLEGSFTPSFFDLDLPPRDR